MQCSLQIPKVFSLFYFIFFKLRSCWQMNSDKRRIEQEWLERGVPHVEAGNEAEINSKNILLPRYTGECAVYYMRARSVSNILFTLLCKIMAYLSIHTVWSYANRAMALFCPWFFGFSVFVQIKLLLRLVFVPSSSSPVSVLPSSHLKHQKKFLFCSHN